MTLPQNLSAAERGISGTLGAAALSTVALRRAHPAIRVGAALLGLGLLARALAGHCAVKATLRGESSLGDALKDQWRATRSLRRNNDHASGDSRVDESLEGTFPASDPPASRIPDEPPSNADEKWRAARMAGKEPS